jgi:GH25 family lysozyme M1 (1,4-beta-N-acetylmuramidase)
MRIHTTFVVLAGCASAPELATTTQLDTACADGPTIRGMDVSSYDTGVDFKTAHTSGGIEFAFVRVSDGTQYPDPLFDQYWPAAKDAGVIRGAYQYFRPAEDPIAQADLLLQKMGPLDPDDLPPVIDLETNGGLTQAQVVASVQQWIDHVAAATGRTPIIYAGLYSWHDLTNSADMTSHPLWVAQYTSAACPNIPLPWTRWAFWQNSDTGSVPGVPGSALDVDVFNGTRDDLLNFIDPKPCSSIPSTGGVIDNGDPCMVDGGPPTYLRDVTGSGYGNSLVWTHATSAAAEANYAQWNLAFDAAGTYKVEVYTDHSMATATTATYLVTAGGAMTAVTIDQTAADGWQSLGDFDFAAGGSQSIHLGDNTGQPSSANAQLVFDAVRLTPDDPTPPTTPPPPHGGGCSTGSGGAGALVTVLGLLTLRTRSRRRRS